MKKLIVFPVILLTGSLLFSEVPFREAITRAKKINRDLREKQYDVEATKIHTISARKRRYFQLDFSGSTSYSTDRLEIRSGDLPINGDNSADKVLFSGPTAFYDIQLNLRQPVYLHGRLNKLIKREETRTAINHCAADLKIIELVGDLKSTYLNHRLIVKKRRTLDFQIAKLKTHLERVENLLTEGFVQKTDVLETRAKLEELSLNRQDLDQLLEGCSIRFEHLCGLSPGQVEPPESETIAPLELSLKLLAEHHPFLLALSHQLNLVELNDRINRSRYQPELAAYARLHYARPGVNFFSLKWGLYFQGGLNLTLPVFKWNQKERDRQLSDLAGRRIRNQIYTFIEESETRLKRLYSERGSLQSKAELLARLIDNAGEVMELKEKLYIEKQVDNLDYLAAVSSYNHYRSWQDEINVQIALNGITIRTLTGNIQEGS